MKGLWQNLKNLESTNALHYTWNKSTHSKRLLSAINIDTRNIVSTILFISLFRNQRQGSFVISMRLFVHNSLTSTNNQEFLSDFLVFLKRMLKNYQKCFLGTTCIVIVITVWDLQSYNCVLNWDNKTSLQYFVVIQMILQLDYCLPQCIYLIALAMFMKH